MSYSKEQITAALLLFEKTGSPAKVQEILGYPSISMLYLWKEWYPELYNRRGKQWKHATLDIKMDAIRRCYYDGESIQSVAEDIGYTVAAIRYWKRKYAKEGSLSFMKKPEAKQHHITHHRRGHRFRMQDMLNPLIERNHSTQSKDHQCHNECPKI